VTYKDDKEHKIRVRTIKASFIALTVLFVLVLIGFGILLNDVKDLSHRTAKLAKISVGLSHKTAKLSAVSLHLSRENTLRLKEIQASRVSSCKRTYSGIRTVLKPFFPKKNLTKAQKASIVKFNTVINDLRAGCKIQTKPMRKPKSS
jgi:hypothetical protein